MINGMNEGTKRVTVDLPVSIWQRLYDENASVRGRGVTTRIKAILAEHYLASPVPAGPTPQQELAGFIAGVEPAMVHDLPATPRVTTLPVMEKRVQGAAEALVQEWSAGAGVRPDSDEVGPVREQVMRLLQDGLVPAYISRGLACWDGGNPAAIPVFVQAAMHDEDRHFGPGGAGYDETRDE